MFPLRHAEVILNICFKQICTFFFVCFRPTCRKFYHSEYCTHYRHHYDGIVCHKSRKQNSKYFSTLPSLPVIISFHFHIFVVLITVSWYYFHIFFVCFCFFFCFFCFAFLRHSNMSEIKTAQRNRLPKRVKLFKAFLRFIIDNKTRLLSRSLSPSLTYSNACT